MPPSASSSASKNWDKIVSELSSGDESDAGDDLNVMSVQKNAHKVVQMLHAMMPGLEEGAKIVHGVGSSSDAYCPPGMNRTAPLTAGISAAIDATTSLHASEQMQEEQVASSSVPCPPPALASKPDVSPAAAMGDALPRL